MTASLRFFGPYAFAHRAGRLLVSTSRGPRDVTPTSFSALVALLEKLPRENLMGGDLIWLLEDNHLVRHEPTRPCIDTPFGPELTIRAGDVLWFLALRPDEIVVRPLGRVAATASASAA